MAWITPSNATARSAITLDKYNQDVVANALMGRAVFTNEAARDAAITSPEEGMVAYLTAPTVPATVGTTSIIPTGITTIYNGSSWVCVTPVAAYVAASQTRANTAYGSLATAGPAVTITTGTTALVMMSCAITAPTTSHYSLMSFEVSGATTRSAIDLEALFLQSTSGTQQANMSKIAIVTGLTAGTNTFTTVYRTTSGTGTFEARFLSVQGIA